MKTISMNFTDWCLQDDDRYMLTRFETQGDNLEEMVDNAHISISDWHGNEARTDWELGDLSTSDYRDLEEIMVAYLKE